MKQREMGERVKLAHVCVYELVDGRGRTVVFECVEASIPAS